MYLLKKTTGKPPMRLNSFLVTSRPSWWWLWLVFPGPWHDLYCKLSLWRMLIVTTKHLGNVTKNWKERIAMLLGRFSGHREQKIGPIFFHWKKHYHLYIFWFHSKKSRKRFCTIKMYLYIFFSKLFELCYKIFFRDFKKKSFYTLFSK